MGAVWLARDTRLGRLVAIKLLLQHGGQGAGRLLAEARAIARMAHENIVAIYELGEHRGTPYIVLEYLQGRTLRQVLDERRASLRPEPPPGEETDLRDLGDAELWASRDGEPASGRVPEEPSPARSSGMSNGLPPERAVALVLPVVRALCCAHEHGIIHRDLKPSNIMLTDAGVVKVLDFGIAKIVDAPGTGGTMDEAPGDASGRSGTLPYMSPEQWGADRVDHRSDIWAVGILLAELVLGRHPLDPLDWSALDTIGRLDVPMPSLRELVPELGPLASLVDRCLIKPCEDRTESARQLLAELEALAPGHRGLAVDVEQNPYAGLAPFREEDAARFFGRTAAIAEVIAMLAEQPLLTIVGPSGAGKSSFVRAGVIPALGQLGEAWDAITIRPGSRPLHALAEILLSSASPTTSQDVGAAHDAAEERDALVATLRIEPGLPGSRLRARAGRKQRRLLLFVDQLEELYTLAPAQDRAVFLACLAGVADDVGSPLRVVLTIRSDFLDRLAETRAAVTALHRGIVLLPPMDRDGLREALVRPLEATGHHFESPALMDEILDAVEHAASALPLLSFAAAKLWDQRDRKHRRLTEASHRRIGGVAGTLAGHADAVLATLSLDERRLARVALLRLITPERTRAMRGLEELCEIGAAPDDMRRVLGRFVEARLLTVEGAGEADATVELVHESLIASWPTLAGWVADNQEDTAFLSRLRSAAHEWEAGARSEDLLWRGRAALDAQRWHERYAGKLAPAEERYLRATIALSERAQRLRRRLIGGAVVALAMLAAGGAASVSRIRSERDTSQRERDRARDRADELTLARARDSLDRDPNAALALLGELSPAFQRWEAARTIAADAASRGIAHVYREHSASPGVILFSPDGTLLASISDDRKVLLRDLRTNMVRLLSLHADEAWSGAFSPDGKLLATGGKDRVIRLVDLSTGRERVLSGHEAGVANVSFSPDGKLLATRGRLEKVRLWDIETGEGRVLSRANNYGAAAFSPDGKEVAFADEGGLARVSVTNGERRVSPGLEGGVTELAFSPDGAWIATAGRDGAVRLWNAETGGSEVLHSHEGGKATGVIFSARGERLISIGADGAVKVRDLVTGTVRTLTGHAGPIRKVAASLQRDVVATASTDGTLRIWDLETGSSRVFSGFIGGCTATAVSPDGGAVAGGATDGTLRLWRLPELTVVARHGPVLRARVSPQELGPVPWAAFSPDGRRVATLGVDGLLRLTVLPSRRHGSATDLQGGATGAADPVLVLGAVTRLPAAVQKPGMSIGPGLEFSADGEQIAVIDGDGTVRVYRSAGGEPRILSGIRGLALSIAFAPDGKRLAGGAQDGTVWLWDLASGEARAAFRHGAAVMAVLFSPDGRALASGDLEGLVRISDPVTGGGTELRGHIGAVLSLAFSRDGKILGSGGYDHTLRSWDLESGQCIVRDAAATGIRRLARFPDGRSVAALGEEGAVQHWDMRTGDRLGVLQGPTVQITELAVSPDGRRLAIANVDRTVHLKDLASGESRPLGVHLGAGAVVNFGPDGRSVTAVGFDGSIQTWSDDLPIEPAALRAWLEQAIPEPAANAR